MGLESVDKSLGQVEIQQPPQANIALAPIEPAPAPSAEQTQALDQAFATIEERNPVVDALWLASAGMVLRDLVVDTLAVSEEDAETEEGSPEPRKEEA